MRFQFLFSSLKRATTSYFRDNVPQLAAAVAFFVLFSLSPLLVIATAAAGFLFTTQTVQMLMMDYSTRLLGNAGADVVERLIAQSPARTSSIGAGIIGAVIVLFGASRLFAQMRRILNDIFHTRKTGLKPKTVILKRLYAVFLALSAGILFIALILSSIAFAALTSLFGEHIADFKAGISIADFLFSVILMSSIIVLVFRFLPDTRLPWRPIVSGAMLAGFLFSVGRSLFEIYISRATFRSTFGAAGSFVVLLVWIFISAQIVLFGAEWTCALAGERLKDRDTGSMPDHAQA